MGRRRSLEQVLTSFFRPVGFVLGLLITVMGLAMIVPAIVDHATDSQNWRSFVKASAISLFIGLLLVSVTIGGRVRFDIRQGFLLTSSSWFVMSGIGALPFLFAPLGLDIADSVFETVSGLTTTGSTVIVGLDRMPHGILLWRGMLQWVGGIGIIVMAIAMLPYLGVGGMQLFRTESSDRSEKIFPRAGQIAFATTAAYLILNVACALLYYFSGMTGFEAIVHAMATLATGGFSTSDSSFGHFTNPATHWIGTLFMLLGGLPFVVYIQMAFGRPLAIWQDSQARRFIMGIAAVIVVLTAWLWLTREIAFLDALRLVAFNVVSVVTTTGFASTDYSLWGNFAVIVFFVLTFVGGCTGSTSGAIKILRFELLFGFIWYQILRLCRPRGVFPLRYRGRPVEFEVMRSAMTFFFLYMATFMALTLALSAIGLDLITASSGAATALGNVGPGLGDIIGPAGTFAPLPDSAKWLLSLGMLLGRLELMTLLVLLMPSFWKK
jgi:trk system potassium uptake protein TrkH